MYLPPQESKLGILVKNGKLKQSKYLVEHTSDLLRVAILSMFGGTYFDNDVILFKRLPSVKKVPNFVGRVDKSLIGKLIPPNKTTLTRFKCFKKIPANGVLRFQRGHKVLDDLQKFLGTNYNPYDWASNGPHAVTYAVKRQNNKTSDKVLVYPEEKFYHSKHGGNL